MIRVLHLLAPDVDPQIERSVRQLAEHLGNDFAVDVRELGHGGKYRAAMAASVRLRSEADRGVTWDIMHAWGRRALTAGALWQTFARASTDLHLIFTPVESPSRKNSSRLRTVAAHHNLHVICLNQSLCRAVIDLGVAPRRCRVIYPGVDPSVAASPRDDTLRRALGFTDEDIVVLAVGQTTRANDHRALIWATSVLHVLDPKYKILFSGDGDRVEQACRFSDRQGWPDLLHLANAKLGRSVRFDELVRAADLAMVTGDGATLTLPIILCMSSGLPLVATASAGTLELLADNRTGFVVPLHVQRLLARRVLDALEDPAQIQRVTRVARAEAGNRFSLERFIDQHREAYRQIVAEGLPGKDVGEQSLAQAGRSVYQPV